MSDLTALFRPRSVAIIGASGRAGNPFARPLQYLTEQGFPGEIYPVNPNYDELAGLPCYASLADVPGPVDLALINIPAAGAIDAVRDCGRQGVGAAVMFSAGFAETGPDGEALQAELATAARDAGVRLLGPNCQGVVFLPQRLYLTFTNGAQFTIPSGSGVAYVGQSGAVGGSILDLARESGMGLDAWVSTGNQADLGVLEVAAHLVDDPTIRVLALYLESIGDGAAFGSLARRADELGKQLVVLRSGRSDAGRRAVASHTGAMVASGAAFDLLARREGVILVDDVDELLLTAHVLARMPVPLGGRLGVVTSSGGAGSLAADHAEAAGLTLPVLADAAQRDLAEHVPEFGSVTNPVDVTAQLFNRGFELFGEVCRRVAAEDDIDAVVVLITMVVGDRGRQLADELVATAAAITKPVYVVWLAGAEQTQQGRAAYRDGHLPVFSSVGMLCRVVGRVVARQGYAPPRIAPPSVADPTAVHALQLGDGALTEAQGIALLDAAGVPRPPATLVRSGRDARTAASRLGGPFACKVQARGVSHKSDVGGVVLNVAVDDVEATVDRLLAEVDLPKADVEGVLVQQMAPQGLEVIVGVTRPDPGYPPVLTLGAGGVATEIHRDVTSQVLPVDADEAVRMLRQLRSWPLFDGHRGAPPLDVAALADAVASIAGLAGELGERLEELEINPLIVHPRGDGVTAVDIVVTTTT